MHTITVTISTQYNISSLGLSFLCQVGLLYDEVSLHNALDMIADWTPEERQNLRNMVMNQSQTLVWEKLNADKCSRWPSPLL